MNLIDRYIGSLLGLASGDALGTTLEFRARGTFTPITTMVGGGPFGLAPGQWTDDTSMAMCLAESLVERGTFDPGDQMRRYVAGGARVTGAAERRASTSARPSARRSAL